MTPSGSFSANRGEQFDAAHIRHAEVGDGQVKDALAEGVERCAGVGGGFDHVAVEFQEHAEVFTDQGVVIHHEDARVHRTGPPAKSGQGAGPVHGRGLTSGRGSLCYAFGPPVIGIAVGVDSPETSWANIPPTARGCQRCGTTSVACSGRGPTAVSGVASSPPSRSPDSFANHRTIGGSPTIISMKELCLRSSLAIWQRPYPGDVWSRWTARETDCPQRTKYLGEETNSYNASTTRS